MSLVLRNATPSDLPFLRQMLFEAVFWRDPDNRPAFEEGLAYPGVRNALESWGKRAGDTAIIALIGGKPAGAAWYRYYAHDNNIRGYYDENIPVLVIAMSSEYRHQGIGKKLIDRLAENAKENGIEKISLMVSKDNYAMSLYRQCGFIEYADKGDSVIMVLQV